MGDTKNTPSLSPNVEWRRYRNVEPNPSIRDSKRQASKATGEYLRTKAAPAPFVGQTDLTRPSAQKKVARAASYEYEQAKEKSDHEAKVKADQNAKWYQTHKAWKKEYNANYYRNNADYWRNRYLSQKGYADWARGTNVPRTEELFGKNSVNALTARKDARDAEYEKEIAKQNYKRAMLEELAEMQNARKLPFKEAWSDGASRIKEQGSKFINSLLGTASSKGKSVSKKLQDIGESVYNKLH